MDAIDFVRCSCMVGMDELLTIENQNVIISNFELIGYFIISWGVLWDNGKTSI